MTWIEKWKQDNPDGDPQKLIEGNCPDDCFSDACQPGYCDKGENYMLCYACWSRECPGTAQEPTNTAENTLKVMLDPGAKMPTRAHKLDAGYDLYSPVDVCLLPGRKNPVRNSAVIDTGVHVQIPEGYVGDIEPKSGLMVEYGIITDGTIDAGYTGAIKVKLFNLGHKICNIEKGQKIAQLVIKKIITPEMVVVDSLEDTERGAGGFGSTGKF